MSELKSTKYRLFPSLLYHAPFLNQQECEMYVKSLETIKIESSSFNNDFYQTTDKLHLLNDMWKGLSDKVIKVIESIADDQCIMRDSFYTTGMWANIAAGAAKGYFHKTHTHPNSFFSAIIYLKGSKPSSTVFYDPRPQVGIFSPSVSEDTFFNSGGFKLSFIEGSIAIFPSWLSHCVAADESDDNRNRISISCNSMLHSEINTYTSYLKI